MPRFPSCWVPLVPAWFVIVFSSLYIVAHPDSVVFARWNLPISEARCLRRSSAGVLELLAPERKVLDVTADRCPTTGSSLPLAETSTAGLLVAPQPPAEVFLRGISL
jgi:hypothetical protein